MITTSPRPAASIFDTYAVVWRMYFTAGKGRELVLRASAVWVTCPAPVDMLPVAVA